MACLLKIRLETATLEGAMIPEENQKEISLVMTGGISFRVAFRR
jgi:hypothetical protein